MFKHILLPTDGSASSDIAVQAATRFASEIGARVTGLHVIQPFHIFTADPSKLEDTRDMYEINSEEQARTYLLAIEQLAKEHKVTCATLMVRGDNVHQAIIQAAFDHQCDLIAMSPHGRKGIRAFIVGSETQRVIEHSQVPVLVFR